MRLLLRHSIFFFLFLPPASAEPETVTEAVNDVVLDWGEVIDGASGAAGLAPIFSVKRGQVVVLALRNETAFPQALHLHGHCFRLLHPLDDGWEPYWRDCVIIPPGRHARIAFVADNPGMWMIHCHNQYHQMAGMMRTVEVV